MRLQRLYVSFLLVSAFFPKVAGAQSPPAQSPSPPQAPTLAQKPGAVIISLDEAIQMALQHNHNLLAARTVIQQNEAEETTANLRPNPVLLADADFLPVFQPSQFSCRLPRQHRRSWTSASAICLSAARSGSTACRRPKTRRP